MTPGIGRLLPLSYTRPATRPGVLDFGRAGRGGGGASRVGEAVPAEGRPIEVYPPGSTPIARNQLPSAMPAPLTNRAAGAFSLPCVQSGRAVVDTCDVMPEASIMACACAEAGTTRANRAAQKKRVIRMSVPHRRVGCSEPHFTFSADSAPG